MIYLDHSASTPVDPRVLERMLPFFSQHFGNAHSRAHAYGWAAEQAVDSARAQVASLLGARDSEIVFTSGGTESCNLAVTGVARAYERKGRHLICSAVEHRAVLDPLRALEAAGWELTILPVDSRGQLDLDDLRRALRPDTALVSLLWANNELGTLLPATEVGALCAEAGALLHLDACVGLDTEALDVQAVGAHLVSLSSHKLYGPKGVGALYVRRRAPRVKIKPLLLGGGQERGLRHGTLNVPGVVGLGAACALCEQERDAQRARLWTLRERLLEVLSAGRVQLHGDAERTLPGLVNVSFPLVEGESLMLSLGGVALASGSACTSATLEPSHVLRALGVGEDAVQGAVRFSLGRGTTGEEIEQVANRALAAASKLRALNPLSQLVDG